VIVAEVGPSAGGGDTWDYLTQALAIPAKVQPRLIDRVCGELQETFERLEVPATCREGKCGSSGVHVHVGGAFGSVAIEKSSTGVAVVAVWAGKRTAMSVPLKELGLERFDLISQVRDLVAQQFLAEVRRQCGLEEDPPPWPVTVTNVG